MPHLLCKILKVKEREKMIIRNMLDMEQHQVTSIHSTLWPNVQRLLVYSHLFTWLSRRYTDPNNQHDCDCVIINQFWNLGIDLVCVILLQYMELMIMTTSWMFCMLKQEFVQCGHCWANTEWDWESPASHDVRLEQYEEFNQVTQPLIWESFCD